MDHPATNLKLRAAFSLIKYYHLEVRSEGLSEIDDSLPRKSEY